MKGEKRKKRVEIKKSETKKKDENQERKIQREGVYLQRLSSSNY